MPNRRKNFGVYFCSKENRDRVYSGEERMRLAKMTRVYPTRIDEANWKEHRRALSEARMVFSTWGGLKLSPRFLEAMPNLEAYFYAAGDVTGIMSDEAWDRGIRISSANEANAKSVAEFVLAQTVFSLKRGWEYMRLTKTHRPDLWGCNKPVAGTYRSTLGLLSIGQISRRLCHLLRDFDINIIATDDRVSEAECELLGIKLVDRKTLFSESDVISIHLWNNAYPKGLIGRDLLRLMKRNATLINTSRGCVINQRDLERFLQERSDVYACIDVTDPEPPEADCTLLQLDNVVLTPHLAGSMANESYRLGRYVTEEVRRYLDGEPLRGEVTREMVRKPSFIRGLQHELV